MNIIQKVVKFLLYQKPIELFLALFYLTLLVHMVIITVVKFFNRVFMLKHKNMFCKITYVILILYLITGSMVLRIVTNPVTYMGCMFMSVMIVNYLFILGFGIKKFKDIEFTETMDSLQEVVDDGIVHDKITGYLNEFVHCVNVLDEDELDLSFEGFTKFWIACISDYLDDRIKYFDYIEIGTDEEIIKRYIKNLVKKDNLWYKETDITKFVKDIMNNEQIILAEDCRIIPITTKRYRCLVYIVGHETLSDYDFSFITESYTILSLL